MKGQYVVFLEESQTLNFNINEVMKQIRSTEHRLKLEWWQGLPPVGSVCLFSHENRVQNSVKGLTLQTKMSSSKHNAPLKCLELDLDPLINVYAPL